MYDEDIDYVVKPDSPRRPAVHEMEREYTWFADNPTLLTVNFEDLAADRAADALEGEHWWTPGSDGGGTDPVDGRSCR